MKLQSVRANRRRRLFEVETRRGDFVFPYALVSPQPSPADPVVEVFVDGELGREAFTYRLASGSEGAVHGDSLLEYAQDPAYLADLALYRLTTEAKGRFEASGLSVREVAARIGTSPTQLYRLLDPTNYAKSARQLLTLLYALGCEVEVDVRPRQSAG